MLIHYVGKINGRIPFKLGNTHISLKTREVFPVILLKFLDFVLFRAVNRNISADLLLKPPLYTLTGNSPPMNPHTYTKINNE
jgi:hypothetical protein